MCGRFTLAQSGEAIARTFHLTSPPTVEPRYNIAPTQPVPVIVADPEDGQAHQFTYRYWGLIPSWSKDPTMGARMINARSETVTEKPSFRTAFQRRRCLVVADGFYEWQGTGKAKQPYFFYLGAAAETRPPFGFAGLWEHWESPEGDWIDSCTILTTTANDVLSPVHDRMPVILAEPAYDLWLDPAVQQSAELRSLLQPYPPETMSSYPVHPRVNHSKNEGSDCIQPLVSSDKSLVGRDKMFQNHPSHP